MSVISNNVSSIPLITHPKTSSFIYQNILDLNDPSKAYLLPLAVIGLVDMNAFFAQVEQIRLDLPPTAPVVCAQWQSLIAVSYPARKFGINRMDTIESAKLKCPDLVVAHAAVFKKGESHWSYLQGLPPQNNHKVSLDPYRRESRKIIRTFQEKCDLIEKASVDECYLDFGRLVYEKLIHLFGDAFEGLEDGHKLPDIPVVLPVELQWCGFVVRSEEEDAEDLNGLLSRGGRETEKEISTDGDFGEVSTNSIVDNLAAADDEDAAITDWDDITILIASRIMLDIRRHVYTELGYTTSGGLSRNKTMAKLAGGFKKPDNQTIVRTKAINQFLNNFELNDFTGLGGKLGDTVMQKLVPPNQNSIKYIRDHVSLQELKEECEAPQKIYDIVRGNFQQDFTYRVDVKSMMSRKNFMFNKPVSTIRDANDWIKVFAGDLYNRMIELDDENLNLSQSRDRSIKRPKTIAIHVGTRDSSFSRQSKLRVVISLEKLKELMEEMGMALLEKTFGNKMPSIANMSLTISGFVKTSEGSVIDTYAKVGNAKDAVNLKDIEKPKKVIVPIARALPISTPKELTNEDKEYIKKMFGDFEESRVQTKKPESEIKRGGVKTMFGTARGNQSNPQDLSNSSISKKEPSPVPFQPLNNPNYVRNLFSNHKKQSPQPVENPEKPVRQNPNQLVKHPDILQSLKKQKLGTSLLQTLLETRYCTTCKETVSDPIEHNDFHLAMELSEKMNG